MNTAADVIRAIRGAIDGRLAMTNSEAELLWEMCEVPGDHIEIGCLWGATAIIAALAKARAGIAGQVYSVDIMERGYWDDGDPGIRGLPRPTARRILRNFSRFGLGARITLICANSAHVDFAGEMPCATTALVDGSHWAPSVIADWCKLRRCVAGRIAFHDYGTGHHPGVQEGVDAVVLRDEGWRPWKRADSLLGVERRGYDMALEEIARRAD